VVKVSPDGKSSQVSEQGSAYPMGSENFRTVGSLWGIIRALMCRPVKFPSPAGCFSRSWFME
jgi:hypothetical protein